jgi:ABC-type antimicrobial peptide transport system permease subunit
MIMNFISASITYKKKEIGILRALGARKLDVFKVFYFEGLIIGLISYFITISLMFVGVILFNSFIQSAMNTNVVLIGLTFRQIILVATICFGAIFASSYLPVNKIANKKPIDAIRNH